MVPWSELEPDQAETLLAVLLYNEHRRAVRVRPSLGDYGIDVLNPEAFDVYRIKYVHGTLTASQKGQVDPTHSNPAYLRTRTYCCGECHQTN